MSDLSYNAILFIDDQYQNYMPVLEPVAETMGINIFGADNVLEGLDFLNEYPGVIQAIILDLTFPSGEMQGKEALEKIKRQQANIPVIMFTDSSSSEDIEKVVECIKGGAYNYVGKRPAFNPVYLFQVVQAAMEDSLRQREIEQRTSLNSMNEGFFTVKKHTKYSELSRCGIFGFELVSINKPYDETQAIEMKEAALEWHLNLLRMISMIYLDTVRINLKYISDKGDVKCYIIITLLSKNDSELELQIKSLQHDLQPFFNNDGQKNKPYLFREITDERFLTAADENPSYYKYYVFKRKPIKIVNNQAGFNGAKNPESELPAWRRPPDEIFPFPTELNYNSQLFQALRNQSGYAEIDLELRPRRITKREIDFIRKVSENLHLLKADSSNPEILRDYRNYLQYFLQPKTEKFQVGVLLKIQSPHLEEHLKAGIKSYFLGSGVEIVCTEKSLIHEGKTLLRYQDDLQSAFNTLQFCYSTETALQAFRLPVPELTDMPGIKSRPYVVHFVPDNLPDKGILMGVKSRNEKMMDIRMSQESLARHLYIMGQTGTGKSTLLKTMITDCLKKNEGFTVIDPHGDLFEDVIKLIPKEKKKKLLILNPTDPEHSAALNPLQYDKNEPQAKSLVINELIRAFTSLYDMRIVAGPQFETYFKNGLLLLMDEDVQKNAGNASLSDLIKVFQNDSFRENLLKECRKDTIKDFFKTALSRPGDQSFESFSIYITSKLTRFVEDFYLSPILTSKNRNIDFRGVMDAGGILLVRMDKGLIGADNTSLLGQIVLSNIIRAAMSRTATAKEERKPYHIFIDEFQNLIKSDAGGALSEVRKYGLRLILANQTLGQLDDFTIQSLLGNVGSLIFFRPGINDYEKIKHYLEPDFKREDVLKLPNFNCIARLLIDNIPSDPFVFQTINE